MDLVSNIIREYLGEYNEKETLIRNYEKFIVDSCRDTTDFSLIKNNPVLINKIISDNWKYIYCVKSESEWECIDMSTIVLVISQSEYVIKSLPKKYLDDESLFNILLKYNGFLLEYASERLQDTDSIVELAIRNNCPIQYTSTRIRDTEYFVKLAIENGDECLCYLSSRLQDSEEIVELVNKEGHSIRDASDRIKNMYDIDSDGDY